MAALLTPVEAAEYLGGGMTETRIRKMAQRHEIAFRRDGRFLRFTTDDLDDYVAATKVSRRMRTTRDKQRSA